MVHQLKNIGPKHRSNSWIPKSWLIIIGAVMGLNIAAPVSITHASDVVKNGTGAPPKELQRQLTTVAHQQRLLGAIHSQEDFAQHVNLATMKPIKTIRIVHPEAAYKVQDVFFGEADNVSGTGRTKIYAVGSKADTTGKVYDNTEVILGSEHEFTTFINLANGQQWASHADDGEQLLRNAVVFTTYSQPVGGEVNCLIPEIIHASLPIPGLPSANPTRPGEQVRVWDQHAAIYTELAQRGEVNAMDAAAIAGSLRASSGVMDIVVASRNAIPAPETESFAIPLTTLQGLAARRAEIGLMSTEQLKWEQSLLTKAAEEDNIIENVESISF